jgi:hypothetical protein
MGKSSLIIITIALFVVFLVSGINLFFSRQKSEVKQNIIPTQKAEVKVNISPAVTKENSQAVLLPTEVDVIRFFFSSINEKRIPEAISMMTSKMVGDDSDKQAWGVQFNAIKNIAVESVDPSMKEEWKDSEHTYKVGLNVVMKPEAVNAPIPFYGWDNGKNVRWISIAKISSLWKISGIATGP